jgi:hypothetical protein
MSRACTSARSFPGECGTPFSGWSKAKSALDTASGVSGWWLNDLRRTLATGLQRLGVRLGEGTIGQRRNALHSTHGLFTFSPPRKAGCLQERCCHSAERAQARCSRRQYTPLQTAGGTGATGASAED